MKYDLLVIGREPEGQAAAIAAAKLGKRVALVDCHRDSVGGMQAGRTTAMAVREAVLKFSGDSQHDLRHKIRTLTKREFDITNGRLKRLGIDLFTGDARFTGPFNVEVNQAGGAISLTSAFVLIATGTKSAQPSQIPFDGEHVFDADDFLQLQFERIPRSMIVVGGGTPGIGCAILSAMLGANVTVVERRERCHLEFYDMENSDALLERARSLGIVFRFGEEVIGINRRKDRMTAVYLDSGEQLTAEGVLFSPGRVGNTESLNLSAAGLETDERGRLWCNDDLQTWVPHIYGAGDVVGFPEPGSITEPGRRAVLHAFNAPIKTGQYKPRVRIATPESPTYGQSEKPRRETVALPV